MTEFKARLCSSSTGFATERPWTPFPINYNRTEHFHDIQLLTRSDKDLRIKVKTVQLKT